MMNSPQVTSAQLPCRALVLIDNGMVKVFGTRQLQVLILNLPTVDSIEGELAREKWLDELLPQAYRDIHWPGYLRKSGFVESVSTAEFKQRFQETDLFFALHGLSGKRVPPKRKRMLSLLEA